MSPRGASLSRWLAGGACLVLSCAAWGQFQVHGRFSASTLDPGWTPGGAVALTAPVADAEGAGWLRLTGNVGRAQGNVRYTAASFSAQGGVTLAFSYASWGGGAPGADGITVFLYDATQNMAGALPGGGLGYCKGAGGYLALALDEYGNFSSPADNCAGGGGPGGAPQALVLRGPVAAGNPFIAHVAVPGNVDQATATARPVARQVVMTLSPKAAGPGYTINVDMRDGAAGPYRRLVTNADFPYAAPAALSVGVAGSTGGAKNVHEVRDLMVTGNAANPPVVNQVFTPAAVAPGAPSALEMHFGATGARGAILSAPFTQTLPAGLVVATPLSLSGSCLGAVNAAPGGNTVTVDAGMAIRNGGCSVIVKVRAAQAGNYTTAAPPGSLQTDIGRNTVPGSASLVVKR
ncbi:hypothetical protein [Polaromonas sp. YR568]|uniref:DUF7933 domain-containing protein n=1 Tax=Polaromonas sp. YR568 TaxID=1855301 RepID=UPI0015876B55|nr:hypothetical protein [Polaromonas sp. YR568]